jgi:nucleosome assembly protein 1-like 1
MSANPGLIMDATEMMKGLSPEDMKALLKSKIGESMHQNASPAVQKRINALKNVQVDMLKIEAKFYDELHELELKYAKTYEPFYEKRRTIVSGDYEPTDEEGKWALGEEEETPKITELPNEGDAEEEKGIKNFWLETLQSFRITSEIIQDYDEEILGYLQDVQVKLFETKPYGYTLEFFFAENPFFTNKTLTKTYVLKTEVDPKDPFAYDGPDLETATGCTVNWKEGKNVCMKMVKKKLKPKNKKQPPKIITKEEKQDSFFNFFETPKAPVKGDEGKQVARKSESGEEGDDEEAHDQELYLIADFEIGQYLKEKIIPKAILFFTGEGVDDEFDEDDYDEEDEDGEGDEDDEDEEDEDDDDDEEEDDDEEDAPKGKGKKSAKGKGMKGKNGEPTPSECKQN